MTTPIFIALAWHGAARLELVAAVVREAVFDGARSVLDPACGDGRFLRAVGIPTCFLGLRGCTP